MVIQLEIGVAIVGVWCDVGLAFDIGVVVFGVVDPVVIAGQTAIVNLSDLVNRTLIPFGLAAPRSIGVRLGSACAVIIDDFAVPCDPKAFSAADTWFSHRRTVQV